MKKLFLTGGTSLLGTALVKKIPAGWKIILGEHKNKNVFPPNKKIKTIPLEILNDKQVTEAVEKFKPEVVIHGAALSNVDYCQAHQKQAWRVNVEGTKNMIQACQKNNVTIIFISTNAVFDGRKEEYSEEDKLHPLNFYGLTKFEGEKLTKNSKLPWIIIRLITMYGWPPPRARHNPVTWALDKLKRGKKLKMVNDVYLNPLYNLDAGKALVTIIKKGRKKNIYHVAGEEIVNRYQWTKKIAQVFGFDQQLVSPVSSSYFAGKIAPRPPRTLYSIKKIKSELGLNPKGIEAGLLAMKSEKTAIAPYFSS